MRRKSKETKYMGPIYAIGQLVLLSTRGRTISDGRVGIVCSVYYSMTGPLVWRYIVLVDERKIPVDERELRDGTIF